MSASHGHRRDHSIPDQASSSCRRALLLLLRSPRDRHSNRLWKQPREQSAWFCDQALESLERKLSDRAVVSVKLSVWRRSLAAWRGWSPRCGGLSALQVMLWVSLGHHGVHLASGRSTWARLEWWRSRVHSSSTRTAAAAAVNVVVVGVCG